MASDLSPSRPLAVGLLPDRATPYTWSILGHIADRVARDCYARQGYAFPTRDAIWHYQVGTVAANIGALAAAQEALSAEGSSTAPSMSQLLLGRGQERRSSAIASAALVEAPARCAAVQRWCERVHATQWRQATVLQVMEEIEPQAETALSTYLDLSLALALLSAQLRQGFPELAPPLLHGLDPEIGTAGYRYALAQLGLRAIAEPGAVARLRVGHDSDWRSGLATSNLGVALEQFLENYGRWAAEPLEAASPRWAEVPESLVEVSLAAEVVPDPGLARQQRAESATAASRYVGILRRRQLDGMFQQLQQVAGLVAEGHRALVGVMAAARTWALGAGHEAAVDGRLAAVPDVFLLELEELKQMMTGEWHDAGQVRAVVEERRKTVTWGAGT